MLLSCGPHRDKGEHKVKIACTNCGRITNKRRYGDHWPEPYLCPACGGVENDSHTQFDLALARARQGYKWTKTKGHGGKLAMSQVVDIFISRDTPEILAARYRVALGTIHSIQRRKSWARVTKPLERWHKGQHNHETWLG